MSTYKVSFMGTEGYEGKENGWYGDCVLIYCNNNLVVYDCGSEQHANKVLEFMQANSIEEMDVILSHNDSDHFDGIPTLIDSGKVRHIFTTLLLKHVDEVLKKLDDGRRNRDSTKKRILELYDNIAQLSGADLKDVYLDALELPEGIKFIAPDKETMLNAVVKAIEENDIHEKDGSETLVNATSLQFGVDVNDGKCLLLLADAAVENVTCDLDVYEYIQLPHHGKLASAEAIFDKIKASDLSNIVFIVSDNTGSSNGGSDKLIASEDWKGVRIRNTKTDGNVELKYTVHTTFKQARENNRGI